MTACVSQWLGIESGVWSVLNTAINRHQACQEIWTVVDHLQHVLLQTAPCGGAGWRC